MEFFDSHSHYNDESFENDRDELINKTLEEILLNKNANESFIEEKINLASLKLQILPV